MKINDVKATVHWRKTYAVEAVRLTDANLQKVADYLGAELCVKTGDEPYINHGGDEGYVGEWLVQDTAENFRFLSHEAFMRDFHTHSEQTATDERYAKVFQLVLQAMAKQDAATYHQDQTGMDLIAIETTKKIIGEL